MYVSFASGYSTAAQWFTVLIKPPCSDSRGLRCNKVTSFHLQCSTASFLQWLPVKFITLFKISLLIYKTLHEKLPVYLHSMFASSLSSHSLRSNKDNSLSVPRVKINTDARTFHFCAHLCGTTCRCLSVQPFQLLPSRNI